MESSRQSHQNGTAWNETAKVEADWLKRWSLYSPAKTAIKDGGTGRSLSYRECFIACNRLARSLSDEYGVGSGDRVAVLAQNELEHVLLFFALQRLGAVMVPINFRLTAPEVSFI